MKEQLLRLRYKGEIVGYLVIEHGKFYIVDHIPIDRETIVLFDNWKWNSFDPSIKVGDEWFFEGDTIKDVRGNFTGVLKWMDYEWVLELENDEGYAALSEQSDYQLIKRAV